MGNNNVAACFHSHSGSLSFPCQLQLGTNATIKLTTRVSWKHDDGSSCEEGEVSYNVEGSKCNLVLNRRVDKHGNFDIATFVLNDSIIRSHSRIRSDSLCLRISQTETGFLRKMEFIPPPRTQSCIAWTKTKKNVHAWGGVADTKVYLYGSTNRCGLLVLECKKNHDHEEAKAVTIAHYFVNSNGTVGVNRSSETEDIGFSVVLKFGVSDGKLDLTVEGPEQHPVSALLYMFDEVNKSGIWKPSMCPHCYNIGKKNNRMFWQSDSEDSDGVPLPPHLGSQKNAASITNDGRFRGHGNGSFITCRNFYGFN